MFYVGQKVVCVDGSRGPGEGNGSEILPVKNSVYTVRGLDNDRPDELVGLYLVEIINRKAAYFGRSKVRVSEPSFRANRFRPAVQTDISIFTAMLTKYPKRESV